MEKIKTQKQEQDRQKEVVRCSFIEYLPEAIECMCPSIDASLLAVGRADGSIDIFKTASWTPLLRMVGSSAIDVRSIHWLEPHWA